MPAEQNEQTQALIRFREDILKAFANIEKELHALGLAVQEERPVSKKRLEKFREYAKEQESRFHDHYAQSIRLAHELR